MGFMKNITLAAAALAMTMGAASAKDWSTIRIGTEGAYPPFNYFDSNRELQGFDIDIAKAICEELKAECVFESTDWDGIIPGLLANKYDAIFASMSATDERRQTIDFSRVYYGAPSSFFALKETELTDNSPEALAGLEIGAQSGTIQAQYLEDNYPNSTVRVYPTQDEVYRDLISKRIAALFVDKIPGMEWAKTEAGACCDTLGEDVSLGEGIAAGVRKEDTELRDKISAAIEALKANGKYDEINAKYFDYSIWVD